MINLAFCVYVLFSEKDFLLYIGYSSNIENRLKDHAAGSTISTKNRGPFKLIFIEYYLFKPDAMKREKYFKTNMGKRALKIMLSDTLSKLGYKTGAKFSD